MVVEVALPASMVRGGVEEPVAVLLQLEGEVGLGVVDPGDRPMVLAVGPGDGVEGGGGNGGEHEGDEAGEEVAGRGADDGGGDETGVEGAGVGESQRVGQDRPHGQGLAELGLVGDLGRALVAQDAVPADGAVALRELELEGGFVQDGGERAGDEGQLQGQGVGQGGEGVLAGAVGEDDRVVQGVAGAGLRFVDREGRAVEVHRCRGGGEGAGGQGNSEQGQDKAGP